MSKDLKVNMKLFSYNNQIILNNNYTNKIYSNSNISFGLNNKTNRKCAKLMVQGNKNCVSCNNKGIKVK